MDPQNHHDCIGGQKKQWISGNTHGVDRFCHLFESKRKSIALSPGITRGDMNTGGQKSGYLVFIAI